MRTEFLVCCLLVGCATTTKPQRESALDLSGWIAANKKIEAPPAPRRILYAEEIAKLDNSKTVPEGADALVAGTIVIKGSLPADQPAPQRVGRFPTRAEYRNLDQMLFRADIQTQAVKRINDGLKNSLIDAEVRRLRSRH